jgi:hypothetical protein
VVAIAPNESIVVHTSDAVLTPAATQRGERRWSGRQTLAFVVGASIAGWCAIGYVVFAALKH